MSKYELSQQALEDLSNIWDFGADSWGVARANRYATDIHNMCEFLAENWGLGKKRDNIIEGLKSYPVGSHTIFYIERDGLIYVIRILHQRMDFERHLPN